jgi:uncharacterized protein (UPF0210 family)
LDVRAKINHDAISGLAMSLDVFSREALNSYKRLIEDNNGIRLHNQRQVLVPIGVDPEGTDVELSNNLDEFGKIRGDLAHKFSLIVQVEHTRGDIEAKLKSIERGLRAFDKAACHSVGLKARFAGYDRFA